MTINDILHRILMAGLGVPEKMKDLVEELVKKGELSESEGARLVKECTEKVTKSGEDISKSVSDIPTRNEVEELKKKLKSLSSKVKKLEEKSKADA